MLLPCCFARIARKLSGHGKERKRDLSCPVIQFAFPVVRKLWTLLIKSKLPPRRYLEMLKKIMNDVDLSPK